MTDFEGDPMMDRVHFAEEIEANDALRATHAELIDAMTSAGEEIPESLRDAVDHHLGYDTVATEGALSGIEGERKVIDEGGDVGDYWMNVGKGDGGFYDRIREEGCFACESHTPGCCDACA